MIIRSQNKKGIVIFNNIDSICTELNCCGCKVVCFNGSEESKLKLGEYTTEEKAIKVLDMIQDAYCKFESVRTLTSGTSIEIATSMKTQEMMDKYTDTHRSNLVFQIPQDSEV